MSGNSGCGPRCRMTATCSAELTESAAYHTRHALKRCLSGIAQRIQPMAPRCFTPALQLSKTAHTPSAHASLLQRAPRRSSTAIHTRDHRNLKSVAAQHNPSFLQAQDLHATQPPVRPLRTTSRELTASREPAPWTTPSARSREACCAAQSAEWCSRSRRPPLPRRGRRRRRRRRARRRAPPRRGVWGS
jgi:hypothetical protein